MKETSSEVCQGRARFQQHRDASCYQVFPPSKEKAPKEIHTILTEILACFLPGRVKDLSAPMYKSVACETRRNTRTGQMDLYNGNISVKENNSYGDSFSPSRRKAV